MSSVSTRIHELPAAIGQEQYIPLPEDWDEAMPVVKDSERGRLLDSSTKFLFALGGVPVVVGIATGIWPVALAGLGRWLLAWLDTNQRRRERKR